MSGKLCLCSKVVSRCTAFDAKKIDGKPDHRPPRPQRRELVTLDARNAAQQPPCLSLPMPPSRWSIAGIMGGANAESTIPTTDLVLEVAYFQTVCIRGPRGDWASSTDSSYRYERGVDPHTLLEDAHTHHPT